MSRGLGKMQREILDAYRLVEPGVWFPHRGEGPVCSVRQLWKAVVRQYVQHPPRAARVAFSRALRRLVERGHLTPANASGTPLPLRRRQHIRFLQLDPARWPEPRPWRRTPRHELQEVPLGQQLGESQQNQPVSDKYSTLNQHLEANQLLQDGTDRVRVYNATTKTWQTLPRPDPAAHNAYWQALIEEAMRRGAQRREAEGNADSPA